MRVTFAVASVAALALALPGHASYATFPKYDQSTQLFMQRTLEAVPVGSELRKVLPEGATVTIYSIEGADRGVEKQDQPEIAMIEDAVIRSMVGSGLKVGERDLHGIDAGQLEHSRDYLVVENRNRLSGSAGLPIPSEPSHGGGIFGGASGSSNPTVVINLAKSDVTGPVAPVLADTSKEDFRTVHWKGADYLVTFRVQEAGIMFSEDSATLNNEYEVREGIVRLHVRVVNAATGLIVYANDLTGRVSDVVDEQLRHSLNNMHPGFFGFTYPFQGELDSRFPNLHPVLRGETNWWAAYQFGFMPSASQVKWTKPSTGTTPVGPKGVSGSSTAGPQFVLGYGIQNDWNLTAEYASFKTSDPGSSGSNEGADFTTGSDQKAIVVTGQKMIFPFVFGEVGVGAMNISYMDYSKTNPSKSNDWALGYHLGGGLDIDVAAASRVVVGSSLPWMRNVFLQGGWAMNSELGSVQTSSEVFVRLGVRSFTLLLLK